MKLELKHLQLAGPIVLLIVGVAFTIAAALVPAGAATEDGYPLASFFLVLGGLFGGVGILALPIVILVLRHQQRGEAERAHVMQHGTLVQARVLALEPTGYADTSGRVWTHITFELPGTPPAVHTKHVPLSYATLELARAGRPIPVYVDPSDPTRFVFG